MSYKARAKSDGVEVDGGSLMCSAHGCPLKWTVKIESPLCSHHAWVDPKHWPGITENIQRHGAPALPLFTGSRTVEDMKTRLRGRLSSPDLRG
jgi:hypothetical protein